MAQIIGRGGLDKRAAPNHSAPP